MKPLKALLASLALAALITSCKKDEGPQLPPSTHEGKNIIAWKMDGKVYISQGSEYFAGNNSIYNITYDTSLYINARTEKPETNLYLKCVFKNSDFPLSLGGRYPYRGTLLDFSDPAGGSIPTGGNQYQTDNTHVGTVIVTYYDSSIIAGTFQMDVVNDAGVVRHITEGQFDISSKE